MTCPTCNDNGYIKPDNDKNATVACPDCSVKMRNVALECAKATINGEREKEHGKPDVSLQRIADFWSFYLGIDINAGEAAMMMALVKVARQKHRPDNADNYIDAIGYPAVAYEMLENDQQN